MPSNSVPRSSMTPEQLKAARAADADRYAAKKNGAAPGGRERWPAARKPTRNQLVKNVAGVLSKVNMAAASWLPPQWRPDLLGSEEVEVLATGIAVELEANPQLLTWFSRLAAASGPHLVFASACAVIAAPRMARRNLIPIPMAQAVITAGTALVRGHAGGTREDLNGTADVVAWPAHGGGRGQRVGQVDANGVAGAQAEVSPRRADEAG